jgi:cation diffusion facilitator family transporter
MLSFKPNSARTQVHARLGEEEHRLANSGWYDTGIMAESKSKLRAKQVRDVFLATLVLNLSVAAAKLICGFWTNSLSMIADGFHSTLDSSSNLLGIAAVTIAAKPPDADHTYGHRKFEAFGAIAISFLMFIASYEVLSEAIRRLTNSSTDRPETTVVSYVVMGVTILVNLFVTRYESKKAKELNNSLLSADAKHTASDIFVSMTVIITLIANQVHLPLLDLIGSVIIVFIILYAGYTIITAHLGYLMDEAVLDPKEVTATVLAVPGVKGCHKIRSRGNKENIFMDLHVQVDKDLSVEQAHEISFAVENTLKQAYPGTVDVLVHIEDDNPPFHQHRK